MAEDANTATTSSGKGWDIALFACLFGTACLAGLATLSIVRPDLLTPAQFAFAFVASCAIPFFACWRQAILEGRLPPPRLNGTPKHQHITGWVRLLSFALRG